MNFLNNWRGLTTMYPMAFAGLLIAGHAAAQDCSNADFAGRYAMQSENSIVGGPAGAWAVGTLYADGAGVITEWNKIDTFVSPATGEKIVRPNDVVATAVGLVTYEVMPDCRITIQYVSSQRPPTDQAVEIQGALAFDGKEVLGAEVLPKAVTGGYIFKAVVPPSPPLGGDLELDQPNGPATQSAMVILRNVCPPHAA